jgi:V8-like Glu-specific endopeptidase
MTVGLRRVLLCSALWLACVPIATSPADAAPPTAGVSAGGSLSQALRFWTPTRMRRARPLDGVGGGRGLARSSAGDAAAAAAAQSARSQFADVPDPTAPGFRQNGVIFFVVPDIGLGRCSGTAVDSRNRSVVITAGHCVHDYDRWFDRDWVFVPGYHDGVRPFGTFVARWVGSTAPWVKGESENGDVGAAVVGRNERGQRLGAAVGGDRIAFGLPPGQVFDVHGYPVEAPFDGATQRLCAATPYLGHDVASFLWRGPLNLGLTCDVTGGASGGGWTIHGDVLDGVTDYGYDDDPATDFGAYFGGAVRALYEKASGQ